MISVALFDCEPQAKYANFDALPLETPEQFTCEPEDCISFGDARQIADQLAAGRVSGFVSGYRWFRQAGGYLPVNTTNSRSTL
jgi:hypothetical protein